MLFEPTSIAIIGASSEEKKIGHYLLKNILTQGYKGKIFPINPKHTELLGIPAFPSIAAVPESVDMAVIVTPAATVLELAKECGKKGVKSLVVISAGFAELGTPEAIESEHVLANVAKEYSMNLVGPNCLGILRPSIGLNASFALDLPKSGSIALVSQSGAMAVALMDASKNLGIGYSLVASIGNKADMDECDYLEICEHDEKTAVIGLYLESIKDGKKFAEIARRITKHKPIVLIKSGVSKHGAMAVSSHTGALAGSDAAITALCKKTRIHRAHSTEEFLNLLRTLASQPALLSRSVAIITNAGGPGIMATDAAEREGLSLPSLTPESAEKLKKLLPVAASIKNPIDVLGDSDAARYKAALETCVRDSNIDGVCVLLTPQIMTPANDVAQMIIKLKASVPLMPIVASFMGFDSVQEARHILAKGTVPCFDTPEAAIHALASLLRSADDQTDHDITINVDRSKAAATLLQNQTGLLSEELTKKLCELYNLPLPKAAVATTADEAVAIVKQIGFPVIAKISSPDILHKTDMGGVRAGIKTDDEMRLAYSEIMANTAKNAPKATITGILIQELLPAGSEFIVGGIQDPAFGPLVMVGLGGIYTELFKDTAFRLAPVKRPEAYEMLEDLKSWKLLTGMRGSGQSDIDGLAECIQTIGVMMSECPMIKEIDLNPVLVREGSISIADIKIVIG